MTSGEAKFREVEVQLDRAVAQAMPDVAKLGVLSSDHSLRRHERGEYLLWRYEFEKNWELDLETARVRVTVTYSEQVDAAEASRVLVWRCAEQFRPGQVSHVRETAEATLDLKAVNGPRLAEVLFQEMTGGAHVLHQAL